MINHAYMAPYESVPMKSFPKNCSYSLRSINLGRINSFFEGFKPRVLVHRGALSYN